MLQLLYELWQRLVESNVLVFLDLVTEPRLQLLFSEVILLLEPLDGHVLLQDLLLEQLDSFLVSLSSCFLVFRSVRRLKHEPLHHFVQPNLLVLGLVSLLDSPFDPLRHFGQERRLPAQLHCLLHQLFRLLDVASAGILSEVDGLLDLDAQVVQVSVDLIFD